MSLDQAIQVVLSDCPSEYAKAYAREYSITASPSFRRVQLQYMLSNTSQWCGERARGAKTAIRQEIQLLDAI